ncbi:acyl transferase/acyl hydrolase/lysophospholipase [Flagelloscypha sp. PMI_526]|nr:acyl transferase/acyl hydrolase/lysophospholipase [Flagelloscypha sp. PMI_526]
MLSSMQLDATHALEEYLGLASFLFPDSSSSRAGSPSSKLEDALKNFVKSRHSSHNKHAPLIETTADSSDGVILAHRSINGHSMPALFRTYRTRSLKDTIECDLWQALQVTTADLGMGKLDEVVIKNEHYSGTSVKNGNPTQLLMAELAQRFPTQEPALVLSLGCSHPQIMSSSKTTFKNVEKILKDLHKDCEETHKLMSRSWTKGLRGVRSTGPYQRLVVPWEIQKMDESCSTGSCGVVATHSKLYIAQAEVSAQIDHVVGILERRMIQKEIEIDIQSKLPKCPTIAPVAGLSSTVSRRKKLLALDGGGLLSISEMFILERILDGPNKRPCDYFDLIGGCGTGGILAILLARFEMTIEEAVATLDRLLRPLLPFIKNDETHDRDRLTSVFVKELENVLNELSGETLPKMFPSSPRKCKAFVLAYEMSSLNASSPDFLGTYKEGRRSMSRTNYLIRDAIRATTASPSLFSDAVFGEGYLVERFTGTDNTNNNPTFYLIEESKRIWPDNHHPFVVSLGAGQVDASLHPQCRGKRDLLNKQKPIHSNCEDTHEKVKILLPHELYHRFSVQHGLSGLEFWSLTAAEKLGSTTKAYCESDPIADKLECVGEVLDEVLDEVSDEAIRNAVDEGNEAQTWEAKLAALPVPLAA